MNDNSSPSSVSPFPPSYRASGVLLHVASLPSPHGIGDVGPPALAWIDRLHEAGQTWWQALPLGPTGYGNSPYQSLSSFAGNGIWISPDWLFEDGLLRETDCEHHVFPATVVDYGAVIPYKHQMIEVAWHRFRDGARRDLRSVYEQFCDEQAHWLEDYALFRPDWLFEDGLLRETDCEHHVFPATVVDYGAVIPYKHQMIEVAWHRFRDGARRDLRSVYEQFCDEQAHWLEDYALFRALKARLHGDYYLFWPDGLVRREPAALKQARQELANEIDQVRVAQFLLFRQGARLKEHARARGVRLIGDLPFFVSPDSSDVWANPELFLLDEHRRPRFLAGVPPDYFSTQGQLWGNPVYNWDALRQTGYRWCIDRLRALLTHVDVIRLDHFRGFAAAWHVPAGAQTAQTGEWVSGPGADFFAAVETELGGLPFIAEDLGLITPDVRALLDQFHLPGTKVLQFAFDGHADNPYLPQNYASNAVVYTGTHDNNTTRGWFDELPDWQRDNLWRYLKRQAGPDQVSEALVHVAWSSSAALAMTPLQDLLNLGTEARMNVPGLAVGNWAWRCTEDMVSAAAFRWLRDLTETSNRSCCISAPSSIASPEEKSK